MTQEAIHLLFDALLCDVAQLNVGDHGPAFVPAVGELVQEKYRIEEKLGAGGMGVVLRATNLENQKPVALKWLLVRSAHASARFRREAYAAACVDHPNVVNVYDVGLHRDVRFLVMELLRGESLSDRLKRGERLLPAQVLELMIPVLRGLCAVHAAGIVHRDLKPDNIFLCQAADGTPREPKLLDFGISKPLHGPHAHAHLTGEGCAMGALAYMSPEQAREAVDVDERTDLYAMGVVLYEALTGHLPRATSLQESEPIPPRMLEPAIPAALERTVLRALAQDPRQRQESAAALLAELEDCAASMRARAQRTEKLSGLGRNLGVGLALALVVIMALSAWRHSMAPERDTRPVAPTHVAERARVYLAHRAPTQRPPEPSSNVQSPSPLPNSPPSLPKAEAPAPRAAKPARASGPAGTLRLEDL